MLTREIKGKRVHLQVYKDVLPPDLLKAAKSILLADLKESEIPWERRYISIGGMQVLMPRLNCAYGKYDGMSFRFSGTIVEANKESEQPILKLIRQRLEEFAGKLNFVYLNRYSGRDYIGWHADDERDMRKGSPIVSISFGASRPFCLRRKDNHNKKIEIELEENMLLIMHHPTNTYYEHSVPCGQGTRVNLTFRSFHH